MAQKNSFDYFANRECPYYPCHEKASPDQFNCLFCYCPLYTLGDQCGGNFKFTEKGIKDCSACLIPHGKGGYDYILRKFSKIAELAKQK